MQRTPYFPAFSPMTQPWATVCLPGGNIRGFSLVLCGWDPQGAPCSGGRCPMNRGWNRIIFEVPSKIICGHSWSWDIFSGSGESLVPSNSVLRALHNCHWWNPSGSWMFVGSSLQMATKELMRGLADRLFCVWCGGNSEELGFPLALLMFSFIFVCDIQTSQWVPAPSRLLLLLMVFGGWQEEWVWQAEILLSGTAKMEKQ